MADWQAGFMGLEAWQVAQEVGGEIYDRASRFPHPHLYALGGQMMRAALSLPVSIAEGFGRRQPRDKAQFYWISHASGDELKGLLLFARDRKLIPLSVFDSLMTRLDRACRLVYGLIESMNRRLAPDAAPPPSSARKPLG